MKYYVIIYQSLAKTSNGLNEKSNKKNGLERVKSLTLGLVLPLHRVSLCLWTLQNM